MKSLIALSSLLAVTLAFPQDISVVRPNHYLQPGTFGNEQHLLPQSFFTPGKQVEEDLKNIRTAAIASSSPSQHQVQVRSLPVEQPQQHQQQAQVSGASGQSSAESTAPDSYSNIGGASGGVASSLTNIHEYGETVPKAFSNLDQDSYAFYHGHKSN